MKKLTCDRCKERIGLSDSNEVGRLFYDVSRSSGFSRFGHKNEKYICEECMHNDPRYKEERKLNYE